MPAETLTRPRQRVNGANLSSYHGRPVCLLGTALNFEGGSAFQVRGSDGALINIRLKQSTSESFSGLIEVYGVGQGKNLIIADGYTLLPEELSKFDMATYNGLINLIHVKDASENPWKLQDV